MKRIAVIFLIVITSALFIYGCAGKEGPTGPAGATGPTANYYDFTLVFDSTTATGHYSLYANTIYSTNDAVVTYWKADSVTYVQLPYTSYKPGYVPVYLYSVIDESYGDPWLWICTVRADNAAGSPWASSITLNFRAVVIKAESGKSAPKIDYRSYQEVKAYYNLPD